MIDKCSWNWNFWKSLILTLFYFECLNSSFAADLKTERGNLTYLGSLKISTSKGVGYYISNYMLSQEEALLECKDNLFGRLLTINTFEEDEFIRFRLQALGLEREQIHTAGRYNGDRIPPVWEWVTTTRPIYYERWWPDEPLNGVGYCINLLGSSSTYGWVTRYCSNPHLFVCQVAT